MRNIASRWFNFYGFDEGEIPNFAEVIAESGKLVPCTYMGRLLLSARAERLDKDAELLAAHSVAAAPYEDPRVIPILLFADVYEVRYTTVPRSLAGWQGIMQLGAISCPIDLPACSRSGSRSPGQ